MNRSLRNCAAVVTGLVFGLPMLASAQSYDLSWHKVAGGGGTSSGGNFTVTGTIGQPDAGHMSGGVYSVDGGFWSIIAPIQVVGAPLLSVHVTNSVAVISWPAPSTGFSLQQNSTQTSAGWSNVNQSPTVINGQNVVTLPVSGGSQFFELKH